MGKKNGKERAADERHERFVQASREWNQRVEKSIQRMKDAAKGSTSQRSTRRAS
jgi:hypothetical protein